MVDIPLKAPCAEENEVESLASNSEAGDENEESNKARRNVSIREFYKYYLALRGSVHDRHFLWLMGPLAQAYVIYASFKIQHQHAEFVRKHQLTLINTLPETLLAKYKNKLLPGQKIGRVTLLPTKFQGSKAYCKEKYTDFRAIEAFAGVPTFMVTFTVNPFWTEIKESLYKNGQTLNDRPDIMCRFWRDKAKHLSHLIEKPHGVIGNHPCFNGKHGVPKTRRTSLSQNCCDRCAENCSDY